MSQKQLAKTTGFRGRISQNRESRTPKRSREEDARGVDWLM
jgi:hypothetical protein